MKMNGRNMSIWAVEDDVGRFDECCQVYKSFP